MPMLTHLYSNHIRLENWQEIGLLIFAILALICLIIAVILEFTDKGDK